jgi:hypothetical protein
MIHAALQHRIAGIRSLLSELETQVHDLAGVITSATALMQRPVPEGPERAVDGRDEAEYLSIRELAGRIPYAEQTIRNLMTRGVFRFGEHYVKPRSRIMFRWSRIRDWLEPQARST